MTQYLVQKFERVIAAPGEAPSENVEVLYEGADSFEAFKTMLSNARHCAPAGEGADLHFEARIPPRRYSLTRVA